MGQLLIVDDEVDLLDALQMILADSGHQVVTSPSAQQALDILRSPNSPRFDAVITDVVMLPMTGIDLLHAARLQPEYDQLPFIYISSTSEKVMDGYVRALDNVTVVRKPFDIGSFCETVDRVVGSSPASK